MKSITFSKFYCDRQDCKNIEVVEAGDDGVIQWREVWLDPNSNQSFEEKSFQLCPICIDDIFGPEYLSSADEHKEAMNFFESEDNDDSKG